MMAYQTLVRSHSATPPAASDLTTPFSLPQWNLDEILDWSPHTPSLTSKIKCCVDQLRSPGVNRTRGGYGRASVARRVSNVGKRAFSDVRRSARQLCSDRHA